MTWGLRGLINYSLAYRLFVEALLDDDEAKASSKVNRVYGKHSDFFEYLPTGGKGAASLMIPDIAQLYLEQGVTACLEALKRCATQI